MDCFSSAECSAFPRTADDLAGGAVVGRVRRPDVRAHRAGPTRRLRTTNGLAITFNWAYHHTIASHSLLGIFARFNRIRPVDRQEALRRGQSDLPYAYVELLSDRDLVTADPEHVFLARPIGRPPSQAKRASTPDWHHHTANFTGGSRRIDGL